MTWKDLPHPNVTSFPVEQPCIIIDRNVTYLFGGKLSDTEQVKIF